MNKNQNPQKLIQETLHTTKKFLQRSAKTLKSLYKNLPCKTSPSDPIFPDNSKKLHNICMKNDDVIDQEKCSKMSLTSTTTTVPNHSSKLKDDSENAARGKPSFRAAAEGLAKKMKELEMMDIKDEDHVSDIEEILHDYSQLSHPVYVEIVDKFFMDIMYTELLDVPLPLMGRCSVHGSMRKVVVVGSNSSSSVHGSMRNLGPIKLM